MDPGPIQDTVPRLGSDSGKYEDVTETSNDALCTPLADTHGEQAAYTPVQYARHLGVTAIAPGHKKVSLKVREGVLVPPKIVSLRLHRSLKTVESSLIR